MADQFIDAEQLLAKMRAGVKESYEIRMRDLAIPVRMLTLDERLDIRNRAMIQTRKASADDAYMASLVQKSTIGLASSLVAGEPGVMSERLLSMLTLDEILYLYNEYIKICDEVNPALEQVSPDQFKQLVDAIKKNSVGPNDCTLAQLKAVFLSYQELIQRLDTQA